jgi:hypothetical protein
MVPCKQKAQNWDIRVRRKGILARGQNTTGRSVVENGWSELNRAKRSCTCLIKLIGAELVVPVQLSRRYKHISSLAKPQSQQAIQLSSCNPIDSTEFQCATFLTGFKHIYNNRFISQDINPNVGYCKSKRYIKSR